MNNFSKEEVVAFDQALEAFEDALVLSSNVNVFKTNAVQMERANSTIWRPEPYIAASRDGTDQTANFNPITQLSVPVTIGFSKSVPWSMSATELLDALQEERFQEAARERLASDINIAMMNAACNQGTLVVPRTGAASGFDDVARCDQIMNEQGISRSNRHLALCTRDYNGMASNLSVASRSFDNSKSTRAYEDAYVGQVSGFATLKLDYANQIQAAGGGGGITISTLDAGGNIYTPQATRAAAGGTGETSNVDNRRQVVTVSTTAGVLAGDCFTIATLNAVHHITKLSTGSLKTFRVISVDSGTTMTISPPIITNQVPNNASEQYQNCTIGTKAANSAIAFLNTVAAPINPFWYKNSLELIPARYAIPTGAGAAVLRATTKQGLELVMTKQFDIDTLTTKIRLDTRFGVANVQPEMNGILLFGQT